MPLYLCKLSKYTVVEKNRLQKESRICKVSRACFELKYVVLPDESSKARIRKHMLCTSVSVKLLQNTRFSETRPMEFRLRTTLIHVLCLESMNSQVYRFDGFIFNFLLLFKNRNFQYFILNILYKYEIRNWINCLLFLFFIF